MKKVLIALDYNPAAQKVAEIGYSLARTLRAEVILLHVISDTADDCVPEYSLFNDSPRMALGQKDSPEGLKRASEDFLDNSKYYLGDDTIQTVVKVGDFAESILEAAKDHYADVIVIGSHSRKWFGNTDMGSVSEDVLYHSSIPLFIIPTKNERFSNS